MKSTKTTTIDAAGRLVIPKPLRQAAGLEPGTRLTIRFRDGRLEIEPEVLEVRIEKRGRVAVAVPSKPVASVSAEEVEEVRRRLRAEREAGYR